LIKLKRAYDNYEESDGYRILVDRLWPRGVSKTKAMIDKWLKDVAPSNSLRKWFSHKESKWLEFKQKYFEELQNSEVLIQEIIGKQENYTVTLIYAAKDETHNNAVALKEYLEKVENKNKNY